MPSAEGIALSPADAAVVTAAGEVSDETTVGAALSGADVVSTAAEVSAAEVVSGAAVSTGLVSAALESAAAVGCAMGVSFDDLVTTNTPAPRARMATMAAGTNQAGRRPEAGAGGSRPSSDVAAGGGATTGGAGTTRGAGTTGSGRPPA